MGTLWGPCGQPPPAVACFVEKLGHLGGLPAAGLAAHDDNGVLGHCLHDHLFFRENRELQPLFLAREGKSALTEWGWGVVVPCRRAEGMGGFVQSKIT